MRRVLVACACALLLSSPARAEAPATGRNIPTIPRDESATRFHITPTTVQVQYALRSFGYSLAVDGVNGPVTQRAVRHFQAANGLVVDGIAGEQTWAAIQAAAGVTEPAVRLDPPPAPPVLAGLNGLPVAPFWLNECDEARFYREQAGGPAALDALTWRESNCRNDVGNSCCVGYLALHYIIFQDHRMIAPLAACQATWVNIRGTSPESKQRQMCAAVALWRVMGLGPWSL